MPPQLSTGLGSLDQDSNFSYTLQFCPTNSFHQMHFFPLEILAKHYTILLELLSLIVES